MVLCRSTRALNARLAALEAAGVTITQLGDTEAAGFAPVERIEEVLAALRPYRRRETGRCRSCRKPLPSGARASSRPRRAENSVKVLGGKTVRAVQ